jgi:hypothetical protein
MFRNARLVLSCQIRHFGHLSFFASAANRRPRLPAYARGGEIPLDPECWGCFPTPNAELRSAPAFRRVVMKDAKR